MRIISWTLLFFSTPFFNCPNYRSVRLASDIVKSLLTISKEVAVNEKASELLQVIISLQNDLLSLQSQYSGLLEAKCDLEQKLAELDNWKEIESQYDLHRLSSGSVIRLPNKFHPTPDKKYWLCANCFEKKKKSFLQPQQLRGCLKSC